MNCSFSITFDEVKLIDFVESASTKLDDPSKLHNTAFLFPKKSTLDTIDAIVSTVVGRGELSLDQIVKVAGGRFSS